MSRHSGHLSGNLAAGYHGKLTKGYCQESRSWQVCCCVYMSSECSKQLLYTYSRGSLFAGHHPCGIPGTGNSAELQWSLQSVQASQQKTNRGTKASQQELPKVQEEQFCLPWAMEAAPLGNGLPTVCKGARKLPPQSHNTNRVCPPRRQPPPTLLPNECGKFHRKTSEQL